MSSPFLPPQSLETLRGCSFKRGNGSFSFFLGQLHEMLPKELANGFRRLFETQLLRFLFACLQNQPPQSNRPESALFYNSFSGCLPGPTSHEKLVSRRQALHRQKTRRSALSLFSRPLSSAPPEWKCANRQSHTGLPVAYTSQGGTCRPTHSRRSSLDAMHRYCRDTWCF
jgi:hypothetical protein